MDLDLLGARQSGLEKKDNIKAFMALNLFLGLHILLSNPKPGIILFSTSLNILYETAGTTQ